MIYTQNCNPQKTSGSTYSFLTSSYEVGLVVAMALVQYSLPEHMIRAQYRYVE
jgi:hypothetical protein